MQPKYRGNGTPERTGSLSFFGHAVPGRHRHLPPAETDLGTVNPPIRRRRCLTSTPTGKEVRGCSWRGRRLAPTGPTCAAYSDTPGKPRAAHGAAPCGLFAGSRNSTCSIRRPMDPAANFGGAPPKCWRYSPTNPTRPIHRPPIHGTIRRWGRDHRARPKHAPPCDNPIDQPEVLTDQLHTFLAAQN